MKRALTLTPVCLLLVFSVALTGCRHKPPALVAINVPPPQIVALEPAPQPAIEPQVAAIPQSPAPLPAKVVPPKRVRKPRVKPAPTVQAAQPAPVKVASIGPPVPAANVVGALTSGGDDTSATQKKASDLLFNLQKRLSALSAQVVDQQRQQVIRVRYFCSQADAALHTGDADGAWTLATKAKVLLDDFSK